MDYWRDSNDPTRQPRWKRGGSFPKEKSRAGLVKVVVINLSQKAQNWQLPVIVLCHLKILRSLWTIFHRLMLIFYRVF